MSQCNEQLEFQLIRKVTSEKKYKSIRGREGKIKEGHGYAGMLHGYALANGVGNTFMKIQKWLINETLVNLVNIIKLIVRQY